MQPLRHWGLEMSGIAGFVGRETPATLRIRVVEDMVQTDAMQRRGPDSQGTVVADERVVLGNTRLRVTDMRNSETDMPMQSADGMLTLTFNGEIYNHLDLRRLCPDYHFRTKSDAESLLAIYQRHGLDMLSMLEGMFAFCLHDRSARRTLLAVDPTGQKPLYYTLGAGDELYFASDIETILRIPHLNFSWDREGLAQAAGIMFVFGPHTHIREIKKLEAGCCLVVEQGERPRHRRYHKIVIGDELQQDVTAITERIRDAVAAGCTRCFDLEIPYAYLLSGGIDSSSVVARARRQGLELHTYAIGFPESGLRAAAIMHNEFSYSRLVAEAFGTEHREIEVTSQIYCEAMDRWWSLCCEPNGAPEAVCLFLLLEQIAADGHRVAFCGSGPDEVFDGYSHGHRLKTIPSRLVAGAYFDYFNAVGDIDLGQLMLEVDARAAFISAVQPYLDLYAHDTQDSQQLTCLLDYHGECVVSEYRQIDMASMAHSIEVRIPLADQQVIQSAFSFLPRLKHYEDSEKWIFKQAMSPWLPSTISSRKKIGFPVPQMVYASPEFEARMESSLEPDSGLDKLGLFDMAYLRRAWRERRSRGYDIFYRLHGMDVIARRHSSYLSPKDPPA